MSASYLLSSHRELGWKYLFSDHQCCLRLAIAIAIGFLAVLCSGLMCGRYPSQILLREPLRRRDCIVINRSPDIAKVVIVVFSSMIPLGCRGADVRVGD